MVHKVPYDRIPYTGFKLKSNINKKNILKITLGIILLFVSLCHLILFDKWVAYVSNFQVPVLKQIFNLTVQQWFPIFTGLICLICLSVITYFIIKAQKSKNIFKNLKFKDTEIELYDEKETASYFDKYLNDILYIFENCEENVFIFEDLDRFDSILIFERLREINNLINYKIEQYNSSLKESKKDESKKHIKFFYLLRDDIFVSKDRTKFFDFLIPVVPVIDGSNSYDKILKFFNNDVKSNNLEKQFLSDLSLYIDDMRLLENIYNEYEIYKNQLKDTNQNFNKLLALIVYKNIFPKDFADLQLGRSFINAVFNTKQELIEEQISDINNRIEIKKDLLSNAKNEVAQNLRELDLIFNNDPNRQINRYYSNSLTSEAKQEKSKRSQIIEEKLKHPDLEQIILKEINDLEKEKEKIKSENIKYLLNNNTEKTAFNAAYKNALNEENNYEDVKRNEYFGLVKYLVRYGYIDEHYSDYITYFYPESISLQDKNFIMSVIEHSPLEYSYVLNNPKTIVDRIRMVDFSESEILNYQLITFLLTNNYPYHLKSVLLQIKNSNKIDFVYGYIKDGANPLLFVKQINNIWPHIFNDEIINHDENDFIKQYSLLTLYNLQIKSIEQININDCLVNYISNNKQYLNIDNPNECLIDKLKLINVHFISFDVNACNPALLKSAYENDLYIINKENIFMIFNTFFNINDEKIIKHKSYEISLKNKESHLYKYINNNINEYIDCMLDFCENLIFDNEETVIDILNNDNISFENKQRYITYLDVEISNLSSILDKNIQAELVDCSKVAYSEKNIFEYLKETETLNKSQIDFINSLDLKLNFKNLDLTNEESSKLFTLVASCSEISDSKYEEILTSLNRVYKNGFGVTELSYKKISILINNKIIRMSEQGLKDIRANYPNSVELYIKTNVNEYADLIDTSNFDYNEMLEFLKWDIPFSLKEKVLDCNNSKICLCEYTYEDEVNNYILRNNMYSDELQDLFENYEDFGVNERKIIFNIANSHMSTVKKYQKLSLVLIKALIYNNSDQDGLDLLLMNFNRFSKENAIELLSALGFTKYSDILDSSKRPRFEINNTNKGILQSFVNANYIYDFSETNGYYSIQRNKPNKKFKIFPQNSK